MPQIGGKYSSFEKHFNESVKSLNKSITYRTNRISTILTEAYKNPQKGAKYWNDVRKKLDAEYKALDSLYTTWAKKNIPLAYRKSVSELMTRLNRSKDISKRASRTYMDLVNSRKSIGIQSLLVKDAVSDWVAALNQGQANLNRLTRRTQQTLVRESLIDRSVAEAIESGNLLNNTYVRSAKLSDSLAAQLTEVAQVVDGQKYVIAGARRFRPKYYAEMVSRVKFHEAQAQGAIQTAGNYGTSLVQVSSHNTSTELCMKYEGKIYSIKGKDPRFPLLTTVPPFHPNCLHLLFPMFESAMEVAGTLKEWENFSKGKTARPPSPASFVPVSERGV